MKRYVYSRRSGFTLVEVLIVVAVMVLLSAALVVVATGVQQKQKIARTQGQIRLLAEAVTAFRNATGYFPLAVPEDAWAGYPLWQTFTTRMNWRRTGPPLELRWTQYFRSNNTTQQDEGIPDYSWDSAGTPSNIHMLGFQLEQAPEASSIFSRIKDTYNVPTQKTFSTTTGTWLPAATACRIGHPLDGTNTREVYQTQDAWGNPLRFWTGDILGWAKDRGWDTNVQNLLSSRLQQANWGFLIESAGKNGRFGWWGAPAATVTLNAQAAEDNVYSVGQ